MHARVLVPRVLVVDATPRRPDRDRIVARAVPSLVCLDRDGVINVDVGPPGVTDVEQFALIPGAARAVGERLVRRLAPAAPRSSLRRRSKCAKVSGAPAATTFLRESSGRAKALK